MRALLFDVFGTLVDWRTSIIRQLTDHGATHGIEADWAAVADDWRARYQPAMQRVRAGRRQWTVLDVLHRESLDAVLHAHGITGVTERGRRDLTLAWHRLDPWPDVPEGLARLRRGGFTVGTLSNGNTALLTHLVRFVGLPMDVLLGAETARTYKPQPQAYLRNVGLLGLTPPQVMLVAAHNGDLAAARSVGLRTAFVLRPTEHGPAQTTDLHARSAWDVCVDHVGALADALGVGPGGVQAGVSDPRGSRPAPA